MKRHDRRVLANCVLFGTLVTAAVVVMDLFGLLAPAENWMYDQRARHFQFFQPPPTDKLVHLDIDDKALDSIGRWPWPRTKLAQIIDELHTAGAKAIGLDILFADPQEPDWKPAVENEPTDRFVKVDHDANLAAAIKRSGHVILPASFALELPARDTVLQAAVAEMTDDIELSESQLADRIAMRFPRDAAERGSLTDLYLSARRQAAFRLIEKELRRGDCPVDQLRQRLIRKQDASVNSPLSRLIDEQYERFQAVERVAGFGTPIHNSEFNLVPASVKLPPVDVLARVQAATAFVDFEFTLSRDGVLRTQPLLLQSGGKIYPQLGLALALQYFNVTLEQASIARGSVTIHTPDGKDIVLPTSEIHSESLGRPVDTIFNIPWCGTKVWETMYDWPEHKKKLQHISLSFVGEIENTRQKLIRTNRTSDRAMALINRFLGRKPSPALAEEDVDGRVLEINSALAEGKEFFDAFRATPPQSLDEEGKMVLAAANDLEAIRRENTLQAAQLRSLRSQLRTMVQGRAALIGWTATGHQDAVPTSLHAQCPGVVAHGAIFNAIITQTFWTVAPRWTTIALTIALGAITAVVAWKFSPFGAFLITSVFGMGYVAFNGLYLFDHHALIVGLAAPQVAMAGVWTGCSLGRIVIEQAERARVTKRLGSYTDPRLVSYVLEKEDDHLLKGETRELTVCFSDMAGFTSLSEKLGQDIVPILNEYLTLMVPVIRAQGGYVNKFLGDGIMYFFGAPYPTEHHAEQAVETALLMQKAITLFNQSLTARGLPNVKVRIGINTGEMVVGDAGAHDAADYTVLGDNVNFASRLESGNKQLGTLILMSARTAELAGDRFLLRPIGALQVVGKTEGVMTYSLTGYAADADDKDRRLVELTKKLVDSFRGKDFLAAREAADTMDAEFGDSILTGLYRNLCNFYTTNPPADPFDGKIVFTEK